MEDSLSGQEFKSQLGKFDMGREWRRHLYSEYSTAPIHGNYGILLTSSEKDDYTATEDTGVFIMFPEQKKNK